MPGNLFLKTCTLDYTGVIYCCLSPWDITQNPFSLENLVPKLSQEICLGKGSGGILTTLRYSFYLFSATSWKVYSAPLKPVIFLPPSDVYVRSFSVTITLIKFLLHKALSDETVFGPGVKRSWSSSEVMNPEKHCKLSFITLGARLGFPRQGIAII